MVKSWSLVIKTDMIFFTVFKSSHFPFYTIAKAFTSAQSPLGNVAIEAFRANNTEGLSYPSQTTVELCLESFLPACLRLRSHLTLPY